ncbi:Fur family ferric uptake transcriptional regulator [Desulfosalsimonas propionicica]|uniref:Ferric uptake regulation protein n=1 Tax=Desulfosalsimonas propionicica TaxID=332175 RepID=A0A7W0CAU8_9BACT|nr:transcriptional repressor [Desulfosalsimonas propionicica]MBA2882310.1 Fur family ferric uptake transcriptional regulator [Desulfosalsimonas propionicica]
MAHVHKYERQQFEKLFRQEQIDHLDKRLQILDAFLQIEGHVTAGLLEQKLQEKHGDQFSENFVTETLELMCRFGFARKNRFQNGEAQYEHRHLGHHHDHMICTKCGRVIEFENQHIEALQQEVAHSYGFHLLQHRLEMYGICSDCMQQRMHQMPLYAAKPGERVVITELTGGSSSRLRLMSMGLRVDDHVEIITNYGRGQVVVAAGNQRYVLGRGLAGKIIVEPQAGKNSGKGADAAR